MKQIARLLTVLLAVLLGVTATFGQPTISGVYGAAEEDSTLVISGSGFGNGLPNIIVFDDFEDGVVGETPTVNDPRYGQWVAVNASIPAELTYSDTTAVSGSQCLRSRCNVPNTQVRAWLGQVEDVFMCYWLQCGGTTWPAGSFDTNWKMTWLNHSIGGPADEQDLTLATAGGGPTGTPGFYIGQNAGDMNFSQYGVCGAWSLNTWRRFAFNVFSDSLTAAGTIEAWTVAPGDTPWRKTIDYSGPVGSVGYTWRYYSVPGMYRLTSTAFPMYDDVYVAVGPGRQKRVEIGDAGIYTSCNTLAILVPTAWSDTEIAVDFRTAQFSATEVVWVFVTDENGAYSAGSPITIGGTVEEPGGGGPTGPPGTPISVTATEN